MWGRSYCCASDADRYNNAEDATPGNANNRPNVRNRTEMANPAKEAEPTEAEPGAEWAGQEAWLPAGRVNIRRE